MFGIVIIGKYVKNNKCWPSKEFKLTQFLDEPASFYIIPTNGLICGMTVLGSEVFVVPSETQNEVEVYNSKTFTLKHKLQIFGSSNLKLIIACEHSSCLYISDDDQLNIYRYNLRSNNVLNNWSVGGRCSGLSVTRSYSVLVTLIDCNHINEYKPRGSFIREIKRDAGINHPRNIIQLSNDQFVVSHGPSGMKQSRVCVIDTRGHIIYSYGGPQGSGVGDINVPGELIIDKQCNVIIADWANNRVVLLSPTLSHLGYIQIPGHQLCNPRFIHLDELNRRLYIGDCRGGHIFVFDADICRMTDLQQKV